MRSLPLESTHLDAGAKLGQVGDAEAVLSYGDGPSGAAKARAHVGLWDRSHRATLVVTGPDRLSWLQGMVTNDVQKLSVGQGCRAAVVTSKGRMVAEVGIHRRADEIWLETAAERAEPLLAHLNRFIIMEDCQVEARSNEFALISLLGPGARACLTSLVDNLPELVGLSQVETRLRDLAEQELLVGRGDDFGLDQLDLWVHPTMAGAVWGALRDAGAEPIGLDAVEVLRIEGGRPRFGAELDEDTLPLEAGLKADISYDKGCYVGQEIIARVTFRGHVNRELRGLWLEGEPPSTPSHLTRAGEPAGELRSATRSAWLGRTIGLGYVKREALADGTELALPDGRVARVCTLPFSQA